MSGAFPLDPPYGYYALPGWAEHVRRLGESLPRNRLGLNGASVLRNIALLGRAEPVDAEVLPGVRARVYPSSNRCEKRVLCAPQLWDADERAILCQAAMASAEEPFVFLDLGANVGLYALTAAASAARAGRSARIIAVEPDVENRRRLADNIAASDLPHIDIAPVAIGAESGWARMERTNINRGEKRATVEGDDRVEPVARADDLGTEPAGRAARGLAIGEGGDRDRLSRIDAMKLDLEGMDGAALAAFIPHADPALLPGLIFVETEGLGAAGEGALKAGGYTPLTITRHNTIYRKS